MRSSRSPKLERKRGSLPTPLSSRSTKGCTFITPRASRSRRHGLEPLDARQDIIFNSAHNSFPQSVARRDAHDAASFRDCRENRQSSRRTLPARSAQVYVHSDGARQNVVRGGAPAISVGLASGRSVYCTRIITVTYIFCARLGNGTTTTILCRIYCVVYTVYCGLGRSRGQRRRGSKIRGLVFLAILRVKYVTYVPRARPRI